MIALRHALSALHLLFGALFLLALGTGVARAVCAGEDLRALLPGSERIAVAVEAARTPNGEGKLWRVTAPNGAVSHLFATMHVADPAVVALSPEARAAFEGADAVVIETVDVLDPAGAGAALASRPDLVAFTDGRSLRDLVADRDEPVLEAALRTRGMALDAVQSLKPWMIAAALAVPPCAAGGEPFLDAALALEAREAGRSVRGLETAVEQMEALAALPMDLHVAALVDSARLADRMDDVFATMGALYREGHLSAIWPTLSAVSERLMGEEGSALGADADGEAAMLEFERRVITERNHRMAERAAPLLEKGGAFVAVGALHLPGEEGVIALLRERGFAAERAAQ